MLGINISGRAEIPPRNIAAIGARIVRCVAYPDFYLGSYIDELKSLGIQTLLVVASESAGFDKSIWRERMRNFAKLYGGRVIWQVGNEPDAGWQPAHASDWDMERRRAESPSSWIMTAQDYAELLSIARDELGGDPCIGAGLCSGFAEWMRMFSRLSYQWLTAVACHPYGETLDNSAAVAHLHKLVGEYYAILNKPLWFTEFPSWRPEVTAFLVADKRAGAVIPFCYTDAMVPGFGLIERPDALATYKLLSGGPLPIPEAQLPDPTTAPPEPVVDETPGFVPYDTGAYVGDGVRKVLVDNHWKALTQESYIGPSLSVCHVQDEAGADFLVYWSQATGKAYRVALNAV